MFNKLMTEVIISKEELLLKIYLYQQCQSCDQMEEYAAMLVNQFSIVTTDERNLFWASFKNSVSQKRASWRALKNILAKISFQEECNVVIQYMKKIENELDNSINKLLSFLDSKLIPNSPNDEFKCFYLKMKSDNLRYKCEYTTGDESDKINNLAEESYHMAYSYAVNKLSKCDPTRLSIGLNYSLFYYQIMKNEIRGKEIAEETINYGLEELNLGLLNVEETHYRKSILNILKDLVTNASYKLEQPS